MRDVTIILVRPEYAGNIGSTARAMANFGFARLTVVAPRQPPTHREAQKFAMKAQPLLARAKVVDTLAEATVGLHYLIGTSRRFGKFRRGFHPLRAIGTLLAPLRPRQRIGLLFGSEVKGLTNDELAVCHSIVTIPTHKHLPSMNLAHAVALVAYELAHALRVPTVQSHALPTKVLAAQDLVEGMFGKWELGLRQIGFFDHGSAKRVMWALRHLFGRTTLTRHEAQMLWAMWQKVLWKTE